MKIKLNVLLATIMLAFMFACDKDDAKPAVKIQDDKTIREIGLGESFTLKPTFTNEYTDIKWMLGQEVIGTEPQLTYAPEECGFYQIILKVDNGDGITSRLHYSIIVLGPYAEGVFILCSSGDNDHGSISFLNDEVITKNIFKGVNENKVLGDNLMDLELRQTKLYITSSKQDGKITVVNPQTMEFIEEIATKGSMPSYLTMRNNKGLVVNGKRKERFIYSLTNSKVNDAVEGFDDVPAINSAVWGNEQDFLVANGKKLHKINNATMTSSLLKEFEQPISGIVNDKTETVYIALQATEEKAAKMVKLEYDYTVAESYELPTEVKLPRNGMLTGNGNETFFWQETSTGQIYYFATKTQECGSFVTPMNDGISFITAFKVDNKTNHLYVAGVTDFFDFSKSKLIIYGEKTGKLKEYNEIGYSPVDIAFTHKIWFN